MAVSCANKNSTYFFFKTEARSVVYKRKAKVQVRILEDPLARSDSGSPLSCSLAATPGSVHTHLVPSCILEHFCLYIPCIVFSLTSNYRTSGPLIPQCCNLCNEIVWSITSKAFDRSRHTPSVYFLLSKPSSIFVTSSQVASLVECPSRKPYWLLKSMSLSIKNLYSLLCFF